MAIDKKFVDQLVIVTSKAALASSYLVGKKDKISADKAAVDSMRSNLNNFDIQGQIVIGEGELDEAPMLYIGEKLGTNKGPEIDIAVDLGGYTASAKTDIFAIVTAPIQLSYIGFLGTMGADYYDYLVSDLTIIPKQCQKYYSEKIIYLPNFQANDTKQTYSISNFSRKDIGLPEKGFVFSAL